MGAREEGKMEGAAAVSGRRAVYTHPTTSWVWGETNMADPGHYNLGDQILKLITCLFSFKHK